LLTVAFALLTTRLTLAAIASGPAQGANGTDDPLVAQGEYLATVGSCEGCHSGPQGRLAGGRMFKSSFGAVGAANITPDPTTGIGASRTRRN